MIFNRFPFYYQLERVDCGPACLKMVSAYYGRSYSLKFLRNACFISKAGTTLEGLKLGAEKVGFEVRPISVGFDQEDISLYDAPLPFVAFWNKSHFVVVYKISKGYVYIADPAKGRIRLTLDHFKKNWLIGTNDKGIALLLMPGKEFDQLDLQDHQKSQDALPFFFAYLKPYLKYFAILLCSLLLGSGILYLFPYLTKSIVDIGIKRKSMNFILLILTAQIVLYSSQTFLGFFQRWLILHISSRINIVLSSDFLVKLTKLPLSFFDNKLFGELFQRINDHRKVESFFNGSTLTVIFSFFNIVVFGVALFFYDKTVFLIFLLGSTLYLLWILFFLNKRKLVDYQQFEEYGVNTDMLIELIQGMQEIKLQNSEVKRSSKWVESQVRLFKINLKAVSLNQYQDGGAFFINQIKDMIITVIAAMSVIAGKITIGDMLAIQFILGQLNSPIQQIINFIRIGSEAKLSLNRIVEIHERPEEDDGKSLLDIPAKLLHDQITLTNVSFRYNELSPYVIKDLCLSIPKGRKTAIVGASGSGKTTLVKLLLGMYSPSEGEITVGTHHLNSIRSAQWRAVCGAVMQDGYIFNDTIANNIAESDAEVNIERLNHAADVSNIREYILSQALGFDTNIGSQNNGLSQGQRQRMLIARIVYKNSDYLFFDEATNSLDAKNEMIIVNNLTEFYRDKTVVIVAHRLSTVRNADNIVVMDSGRIVESGTHNELIDAKGYYFELIRNQLELGN